MSDQALFDTLRRLFGPLTQAQVDEINRALKPQTGGLRVSSEGLELIKSFEGCRLHAYPDPGSGGDPWTIGYGSTGPDIKKGLVWTLEQADERFARDTQQFAEGVANLVEGSPTTQAQFDAMVSLAYNIGLGAFGGSTLLKKHKARDHVGAASQFLRWNRAGNKIMAGLTRRREAEMRMYQRRAA